MIRGGLFDSPAMFWGTLPQKPTTWREMGIDIKIWITQDRILITKFVEQMKMTGGGKKFKFLIYIKRI